MERRNDLETKVAALEHIYDHEQASPRTLEAIIARKNKLNAGWTKESLAHLDNGQKVNTFRACCALAGSDGASGACVAPGHSGSDQELG
eukprot:915755-Rhodomonas_salina.1